MADVTVRELAVTVGAPVDRLLKQMQDAGLPHTKDGEAVSEEQKQELLAFLKRSHGESDAAPRKITLTRKSVGTLKAGGQGKGRTVAVEVRKKRTYVKRGDAGLEPVKPAPGPAEAPAKSASELEAERIRSEEMSRKGAEEETRRKEAERKAEDERRRVEAEKQKELERAAKAKEATQDVDKAAQQAAEAERAQATAQKTEARGGGKRAAKERGREKPREKRRVRRRSLTAPRADAQERSPPSEAQTGRAEGWRIRTTLGIHHP